MTERTRTIGLSLGADLCWPACYEEIVRRLQLAIPLRVIGSNVAISCQLDCHVAVREMAERLIPGFAEPHPV